jgi:uncharacterized membrane protein YphA (DoxX/SURF4 family)
VFWQSGQTKVAGFSIREETFAPFRDVHNVPLMPPEFAAYLATIGGHVFSVLLVVGLASKLSATERELPTDLVAYQMAIAILASSNSDKLTARSNPGVSFIAASAD